MWSIALYCMDVNLGLQENSTDEILEVSEMCACEKDASNKHSGWGQMNRSWK